MVSKRSRMESIGDFEYNSKEMLGHGAFACVFQGNFKSNKSTKVAIKRVTRKNLAKSPALLDKEITILRDLSSVKHENIVHLMHVDQNADFVFLVMEFCNGGDLNDYLTVQKTLSEDTIQLFVRQIGAAMKRINSLGIVHRDLKPQNLLLCFKSDSQAAVGVPPGKKKRIRYPDPGQISIKLADFGFARVLSDGHMAGTMCGSPMYMAPEVLMMWHYDCKADLWSIGTIMYQCLTGHAPFYANSPQALKDFYEKNAGLRPKIPSGTSSNFSDLLCRMLRRNPKERIDFEDFFHHPFLSTDLRGDSHITPELLRRRNSSTTDLPVFSSSPLSHPSQARPNAQKGAPELGGGPTPITAPVAVFHPASAPTKTPTKPKDDFVHVVLKPNRDGVVGNREDDFIMIDSDLTMARRAARSDASDNAQQLFKESAGSGGIEGARNLLCSTPTREFKLEEPPREELEPKLESPAPEVETRPRRSLTEPHLRHEPVPIHQRTSRIRQNSSSEMPDLAKLSPPPVKFMLGRRNSLSSSSGGGTPPSLYTPYGGARSGSPSCLLLGVSPSARPNSIGRYGGVLSPIRDSSAASADATSPLAMAQSPGRARMGYPGLEGYSNRPTRCLTAPSAIADLPWLERLQHSPIASPGEAPAVGFGLFGNSPVDDFLPPAPEALSEEALMKDEHNQTMDRLRFLALTVEFIGQLALERASPLAIGSTSDGRVAVASPARRDMEQLVLYVRSQQYLSACFTLAQESIEQGKLGVTQKVYDLLCYMNSVYHRHYIRSQQLKKEVHQAMHKAGSRRRWKAMQEVNADRLIFDYIVKLCRDAMQSEILEKGKECFSAYRTAHVLLHCLCTHTSRDGERGLLEQCKQRVERRLLDLGYSPDPLRAGNSILNPRS